VSKEDLKNKIKLIEQAVDNLASAQEKPTKKPVKVVFDKSSPKSWDVVFSERGFLIDNTRLSFEEIKNALSKGYNISLNGGKGLVLDAVKMQSIMKYEDLF
jgi:hypothetical protein